MRAFLIYVVTVALVGISSTSNVYATAAAGAASQSKSNVITLIDSNFTDILKSDDLWLIDFYAPWCQHCKVLDVSAYIALLLLYL
jgi:thiol:disulfide interchange protein